MLPPKKGSGSDKTPRPEMLTGQIKTKHPIRNSRRRRSSLNQGQANKKTPATSPTTTTSVPWHMQNK
jgi:hypothetical protein